MSLVGAALLVHRRTTWRSFFHGPISWFVSWRIQRLSGYWNHAAVCIIDKGSDQTIIEAHFRGLRVGSFRAEYGDRRVYEYIWVYPPRGTDLFAIERAGLALAQSSPLRYSFWTILKLRWRLFLYGQAGVHGMTDPDGGQIVICSDLVRDLWEAGGWRPPRQFLTPSDLALVSNETVMEER